ncbi:uncharacterized protein MONOS_5744 [Monocercomonoides exilis]|uniref:uncharacterized protein n=1 Tax=Monocercomonoides exilis TaxID=2049356 RepID=UPI00355A90C2|nr:hypothetical protein MONOS_5744 [Monocercomonoides exilis]
MAVSLNVLLIILIYNIVVSSQQNNDTSNSSLPLNSSKNFVEFIYALSNKVTSKPNALCLNQVQKCIFESYNTNFELDCGLFELLNKTDIINFSEIQPQISDCIENVNFNKNSRLDIFAFDFSKIESKLFKKELLSWICGLLSTSQILSKDDEFFNICDATHSFESLLLLLKETHDMHLCTLNKGKKLYQTISNQAEDLEINKKAPVNHHTLGGLTDVLPRPGVPTIIFSIFLVVLVLLIIMIIACTVACVSWNMKKRRTLKEEEIRRRRASRMRDKMNKEKKKEEETRFKAQQKEKQRKQEAVALLGNEDDIEGVEMEYNVNEAMLQTFRVISNKLRIDDSLRIEDQDITSLLPPSSSSSSSSTNSKREELNNPPDSSLASNNLQSSSSSSSSGQNASSDEDFNEAVAAEREFTFLECNEPVVAVCIDDRDGLDVNPSSLIVTSTPMYPSPSFSSQAYQMQNGLMRNSMMEFEWMSPGENPLEYNSVKKKKKKKKINKYKR